MTAPKEIEDLVSRFEQNIESYKSAHYNETQVRQEFVDPFFEALGWDVNNRQGFAEAYKDVVLEESIRVGASTRAPDYSFRIGGQRKFFLETKKPSVDIKEDIAPAFQLRRYAWTAKLPLSILTDFEEFSVYDCRIKPDKADKSSQARVLYLTFREYLDRWDEICNIFSKEAILKGSFDKFAEDKKSKRGTAEVDAAFLEEIAGWREVLARNLALRNTDLSTKDLNYAVQAIVNRIVFLRICEDRGIERHMRLQDLLDGERVYPRLCELFHRADERYDSGLFHFEKEPGREDPDTLTLGLTLDDKTLKDIIQRLYYPDCPYEFSVFPAEILGQVYEQFLGKVIRLTEGHRAVVEDKPEVKKAGGVKYTPVYIVDYIVKTTLGPMLEGKTPQQVVLIHVLDPACGSGSFLIVAYQYLLDWHRDWYVEKLVPLLEKGLKTTSPEIKRSLPNAQNEKGKKGRKREPELPIYQGRGGEWRLTTAERKRILLNNIYGVDIDSQAVEVTKLSLLLKVLEGENEETIEKQLKLFQERALPDLGNNIKCGNSLIGWDILKDNPGMIQEEIDRINPFDWEKEFPEVFQNGGFSAVIGNPPYIRMESFKEIKNYLREKYAVHGSRSDLYAYFVERGHKLLCENGAFAMILSNKFIKANYGVPLRRFLYLNAAIREIADFAGLNVFQGVTVRTLILSTSRTDSEFKRGIRTRYLSPIDIGMFNHLINKSITVSDIIEKQGVDLPVGSLNPDRWLLIDDAQQRILKKLQYNMKPLSNFVQGQVLWGVKTGFNEAFIIDKDVYSEIIQKNPQARAVIKPILFGEDVRRYSLEPSDRYIIYTYHGFDISKYPAIEEHLRPHKNALERRATKQAWYELQQPSIALVPIFEAKKILYPEIAKTCHFTLDDKGYFSNNKTFILPTDDLYILGILNSKLALFYFRIFCAALEGSSDSYLEFRAQYVREFPIHTIDISDPNDASRRDNMISMVDQMLSLHKHLQEARTPHEKTALQRQIEATDHQIDALVYELYGLTEEEIKIVEGSQNQYEEARYGCS